MERGGEKIHNQTGADERLRDEPQKTDGERMVEKRQGLRVQRDNKLYAFSDARPGDCHSGGASRKE